MVVLSVKIDNSKALKRLNGIRVKQAELEAVGGTLSTMAEVAQNIIYEAILTEMPNERIGNFMLKRTAIEVVPSGDNVTLIVRGLSEGEVPNATRADGTTPTVNSPAVNLWLAHEFGRAVSSASASAEGGGKRTVVFEKDDGFRVIRTLSNFALSNNTPYVGEIRRIISGLDFQLETLFRVITEAGGVEHIGEIVSEATGEPVDVNPQVFEILSRAGITSIAAGIKSIELHGTQINLRSSGGQFVSGGGRIPTSIRI